MVEPRTVNAPAELFRVARSGTQTKFSELSPEDNVSKTTGNRYDVVGGGVLYAASTVKGCLYETLARYRPSPRMLEVLDTSEPSEPGYMLPGQVPQDWRLRRNVFTIQLDNPLPFLDVDHPATYALLDIELAPTLRALGYEERLDISDIKNRDRTLSRAIAAWAYGRQDDRGMWAYSGIQYRSRIDVDQVCWAIFYGTKVTEDESRRTPIDVSDSDLLEVTDSLGIRVF